MDSNIPTSMPTRKPLIHTTYSTSLGYSAPLRCQVSFEEVMAACDGAAQGARWKSFFELTSRSIHRLGMSVTAGQQFALHSWLTAVHGWARRNILDLPFLGLRSTRSNTH